MTTIGQHLDKHRDKAHKTQDENGHYLHMTIQSLRSRLKRYKERIRILEDEAVALRLIIKTGGIDHTTLAELD